MTPFEPYDSQFIVDVAMGRRPAGLVITHAQWVSVQTGEIIPNTDVAVIRGRIAYVGSDASHCIGPETTVVDAKGKYLVPGLLDAHMHVESGMLTVTEFVRAIIPHGTTGIFVDPHEIANVFGLRGVRLMVDEAAKMPIHVYVQMPSCVPSAPGLETPGAQIGPTEVAEAMTWPGIIGLGEMMNFPGVISGDDKVHAEMAATRRAEKVIGGHYASPDLGLPFHGYAAGGPQDDHEGTRMEDAIERARQGMRVMMRYGSAWHDVAAQAPAITHRGLSSRMFLLCTDDSHSETLVHEGHMDRVLRHAIQQGIEPMVALQMATINTAEYFGVSRDMGLIAPGRYADLLLVPDLSDFHPEQVYVRGKLAATDGQLEMDLPRMEYPEWAHHSVNVQHTLVPADFRLVVPVGANQSELTAHVIGIIENQAPTKHLRLPISAINWEVKTDLKRDLAKIALVERHHNTGRVQVGLIQGFGFTEPCGIATTVAHDCHHMIVVGTSDEDMALAANTLVECGGGQAVVKHGKVIGKVELTIAGLMSTEPAEVVAEKAATVLEGFK
ncbi:MAG TPA: adenine deaminase C-terminal domain-containing protein, partial [Longilinea sp.]|nr:adenine deaminase C-terminal domain-containing protein [Longilinea sp.]